MSVKVTTQPSAEPVAIEDVQDHLSVARGQDTIQISGMLASARIEFEDLTWRKLINQTLTMTLDRFPPGDIILPFAPLSTVTSIQYVDDTGVVQTWAASNYNVDSNSEPGRIERSFGNIYPSTRVQNNAVTIIYTAGYGSEPTDVPEDIRHMLMMRVGEMYQNRETSPTEKGSAISKTLQTVYQNKSVHDSRLMEFV